MQMNYELMHKDIPVAGFTLDHETSSIIKVNELYNPLHLPVGIPVSKHQVNRASLNDWWKGRAIPASRQGIRAALEEMQIAAPQNLLEKCLGLSLFDQYWIRPEGSNLRWSDVNFFENSFSDDVGNILFGKGSGSGSLSLMSPDNTSDGWLKKKWAILDGRRCLLKGGSGVTQQEPYNEVFASTLMNRLGINHVEYRMTVQDDYPFSVCEDFITPDTELVSAWYVMQTQKKENHVSVYQHCLNCCDTLGIPNVREALDRMIVIDYLLVNEDRHQNNFGFIRNADTLEWIGTAPVYDSGTSLWFDTPTPLIHASAARMKCKPFKTSHEEQIKLVNSFEWIDWHALDGIEEEFMAITNESLFVDEARRNAIAKALKKRVEMLKECARIPLTSGVDMSYEVHSDIAFSGKQE